ncbi:MAG: hypothetical protein ABI614_06370 [Planctomycetota bacterium]
MSDKLNVDMPKDSISEVLHFDATIETSYLACLLPHVAGVADPRYSLSGAISANRWLDDLEELKVGTIVQWEYPFLIRVLFGVYPMLNQMVYELSPGECNGPVRIATSCPASPEYGLTRYWSARTAASRGHPSCGAALGAVNEKAKWAVEFAGYEARFSVGLRSEIESFRQFTSFVKQLAGDA